MFRRILSFFRTKIGISLLLAAAIVGGAFFLSGMGASNPDEGVDALVARKAAEIALDKDSDGDGLKDWEESIYGTDPQSADTDGDGVGDKDDVKSPVEADPTVQTATTSGQTFTATDRFSQELFIKYVEAKREGKEIDAELSDEIAQEILSKSYGEPLKPFDPSALTLVDSASPAFIRTYGNSLGSILSTPVPAGTQNEFAVLEEIMVRGTATDKNLADLEKLHDRYASMRDRLIALRAPVAAADAHAEMIQGIEVLRTVVEGIKGMESDPVGSLSKISLYEDGVGMIEISAAKLKRYFFDSGISFSAGESGASLTR